MSENDRSRAAGNTDTPVPTKVKTAGGGGWLFFLAGLGLTLVAGWGLWPGLLYSEKTQPFPFNHLAHTDKAGLGCDECHKFDDQGRFSGAPGLTRCLDCHSRSSRQDEKNQAETAFLEKFVTEDDEIKKEWRDDFSWHLYSRQPDCVFFSHAAHVELAKMKCEECHGDHGRSKEPRPYYRNRLTNYSLEVTRKMKMNDCADCHAQRGKPEANACFVCHK
ncbi:MAG: menaquinone reductase multiheme cytochrome c subunit QrcA [Thermodesulfobacteriota bacterium]